MPLPKTPFFLKLEGQDSDGNDFWRMSTSLISPSTVQVDVSASAENITATPGKDARTEFIITNYGTEADIVLDIVDSLGFLKQFTPKSCSLLTNYSCPVR